MTRYRAVRVLYVPAPRRWPRRVLAVTVAVVALAVLFPVDAASTAAWLGYAALAVLMLAALAVALAFAAAHAPRHDRPKGGGTNGRETSQRL